MKFSVFHRLHGVQPLTHILAHRIQPGWYSLECGSWTLEVEVSDKTDGFLRTLRHSRPLYWASALASALLLWLSPEPAHHATLCAGWMLYSFRKDCK